MSSISYVYLYHSFFRPFQTRILQNIILIVDCPQEAQLSKAVLETEAMFAERRRFKINYATGSKY